MSARLQHTTHQDVHIIQFDDPECMENISVNYHPGEYQARGFCIQSKRYPIKGIAIEYLYTPDGDSITEVIHMMALSQCGERI